MILGHPVNITMNRKRFRKDISHISKRHLNRLAAQESKLICDSLLNTSILSHSNDYENAEYLKNDSTINSHKCYETLAIENDTISERNNISIKCENDEYIELIESDSEQSSVSISQESVSYIANANTENANTTDDFKNSLAVWATEYQISHTALRALLQRLKQHSCFSKLLLDARSLLQTPRRQEIRIVIPGTYYHFGLLNSVLDILTSIKDNIDCVKIAINIDGLPLSKSSSQQFWPILGSVLSYDNVFLIGLYHGNEKPANVNDFLKDFVDEVKDICENGINVNGCNIPCRLAALICDTPAKAFVLCVNGHSGYFSCTKCRTEGEYVGNRICFPQVNAPLRTDDDFKRKIDENYHKPDITCSLLQIPHFKPVNDVPLDYMHLICLGIMRKLIYLWLDGELHYRLQSRAVQEISTRLVIQLKPSIPAEFARKPRSMNCVKLWKATEYRLILLYTGPLAFKSILKKNVYIHFLILHVIIRILSSSDLNEYVTYAQDLVLLFIKRFMKLYGVYNMSHNIHNLIHLIDDVKKFGPLDNFSAFKFENYMQILKKYIRKADRPLQQVIRRYIEKEINSDSSTILSHSVVGHPNLILLHHDGPLISNCKNPQYKIVKYNGIILKSNTLADSCCGLNCGSIVSIKNIAYCTKRNIPVIIGREFLEKKDLFNMPCPSSFLGIYIVHSYSDLKSWPLKNVIRKYVKLPYGDDKYAVFPLIHSKM
ncbi:uncharacterized protein [Polyergus mexicanus]|uniref:uncharacterized protein n=1 Tax=Polyergus mexicanus TaxID=615972 RepID=UPI0038B43B23